MLIIAHRKTQTFTGTLEECRAGYKKVRTHNLVFGWWGFPVAPIWNAMALRRNARALRDLEALSGPTSSSGGGTG